MTLKTLISNRTKAPVFSRNWLRLWAKRALSLPSLVGIVARQFILISFGAKLGKMSIIEAKIILQKAGNLRVGDGSFIAKSATLALHERITIGNHVAVNSGVKILTGSHSTRDPDWHQYNKAIVIEDYAWIATDAILLPGVVIGFGAIVGAGAVIRSNVPAYSIYCGNPAKRQANERTSTQAFNYSPVRFVAAYAAWIDQSQAQARDVTNVFE